MLQKGRSDSFGPAVEGETPRKIHTNGRPYPKMHVILLRKDSLELMPPLRRLTALLNPNPNLPAGQDHKDEGDVRRIPALHMVHL